MVIKEIKAANNKEIKGYLRPDLECNYFNGRNLPVCWLTKLTLFIMVPVCGLFY